ncbi:hypothetical protein BBD42_09925 [Paenibacillus sp. BIHB 4019]|uniref:Uncharacterized protein n=1 Tax=Paenibacillus sp. BIHB 4019 TaxID=1870819 RepID=A0A1B2DSJ0_9BACL|nr:hypothetical protein BBD42_09925 [Paenibacillus sp. BIHB 4019]
MLLGLYMKAVQQLTGETVYTLLLNIDYITLLNELALSELGEFALHLVVSALVGIGLALAFRIVRWPVVQQTYAAIAVSLLIGLALFPTTLLSDRTPSIESGAAWSWWLVGHAVYGWVLGELLGLLKRKRRYLC